MTDFARFDSAEKWLKIPVEVFGNQLTQSGIREAVARIAATPGKELVNLGSHEQYCYSFYARCLSDHLERPKRAILPFFRPNPWKAVFEGRRAAPQRW